MCAFWTTYSSDENSRTLAGDDVALSNMADRAYAAERWDMYAFYEKEQKKVHAECMRANPGYIRGDTFKDKKRADFARNYGAPAQSVVRGSETGRYGTSWNQGSRQNWQQGGWQNYTPSSTQQKGGSSGSGGTGWHRWWWDPNPPYAW
jgi:hypothetical protein